MGIVNIDYTSEEIENIFMYPLPVGSILPFHSDASVSDAIDTDYWVLCDDENLVEVTFPDSVKLEISNYNLTDDIFLMGSTSNRGSKSSTSSTSISPVTMIYHEHTLPAHTHSASGSSTLSSYTENATHSSHSYNRYLNAGSASGNTGSVSVSRTSTSTSTEATNPGSANLDFDHTHGVFQIGKINSASTSVSVTSFGGSSNITKDIPKYFTCKFIMKVKG